MPSGYPLITYSNDDPLLLAPTMPRVRTMPRDPECLLVTRDPSLIDAVSATALALGTAVVVAGDRDEIKLLWAAAGVRLVGSDMAGRVAGLAPVRDGTWVVGQADVSLLSASAELRVPVLALPGASAQLAEALTRRQTAEPHAHVVVLVGGSGGVGTSSLAVGLSLITAKRGKRVAVLELAECGGGLDLLLGMETSPGVRWNDVANASGELGGLDTELVKGDGVSLLSLNRDTPAHPSRVALDAVLRSLARSQDLVLVDGGDGRCLDWLRGAPPVLLVAGPLPRGRVPGGVPGPAPRPGPH